MLLSLRRVLRCAHFREKVTRYYLVWLYIDPEKNAFGTTGDSLNRRSCAKIRVLVIPTDGESVIARDVERLKISKLENI